MVRSDWGRLKFLSDAQKLGANPSGIYLLLKTRVSTFLLGKGGWWRRGTRWGWKAERKIVGEGHTEMSDFCW